MLTQSLLLLKKHAWLLAVLYTILITILSFLSAGNIPKLGIDYEDKIVHLLVYFVFSLAWYNVFLNNNITKAALKAVLFALIYGIIIEVLQGSLTATRQFDYYDITANSLGALLAIPFFKLLKTEVKKL